MDTKTKTKIDYFCSVNKNDYAVAVYISQFVNYYELYGKLLEFKINYIPDSILHEVFSMELYLLYNRFGEIAVDAYYHEYATNNFTRELEYVAIANEEYARYIFSLKIDEVDEVDEVGNLLYQVL
jgi:methionine synthase II (cobalamin-independent)